jgi:hypothetical protein
VAIVVCGERNVWSDASKGQEEDEDEDEDEDEGRVK